MNEVTPHHDLAWRQLREALFEGRFAPGQPVTVASVARSLGLGTMPVREALRRVTAEGGFTASPTRRLSVPDLPPARLAALLQARSLLEPQAAAEALPFVDAQRLAALEQLDADLSDTIRHGSRARYMQLNFRFHFLIYRAAPDSVLCPLIESLWLQTGPHMYHLLDRAPDWLRQDRHQQALRAIRARDADALRQAVAGDISDAVESLAGLTA